jgi:hypothetical protein
VDTGIGLYGLGFNNIVLIVWMLKFLMPGKGKKEKLLETVHQSKVKFRNVLRNRLLNDKKRGQTFNLISGSKKAIASPE